MANLVVMTVPVDGLVPSGARAPAGTVMAKSGLAYARPALNTLRLRQNGHCFADHTFKHIFLNENVRISLKNSLKFVTKVQINNIPALVQIMAWRRPGDKLLSESMMVDLPMHICVTQPSWVLDARQASISKWPHMAVWSTHQSFKELNNGNQEY